MGLHDAGVPDIATNLAEVRARMVRAAADCGRDPGSIELIAVSKLQPEDRVAAALAAGHRLFGENRVQEAEARWAHRRADHPDLTLHLIGPLQTNKVRDAVALFDAIETVDRPKLVHALARGMAQSGRRPDCFLQVNTGAEPQKAGVAWAELDDLFRLAAGDCGLPVVGLMCIPPADDPPAPHFALLAEAAKRLGLPRLSMGMTGDFETAIHQGATQVRVGTAVFGERAPKR
ncbi:MAG: YggS family pyridoxal phosphate-dependent enzyme [Rhodospirillaceae bacterium]|nr:YggS family pyridoxal phosphate-dependent enzyme [Rhodospirillaceae bacterium]